MPFAGIDHGFHGKGHPLLQLQAGAGLPIVQDLRILVVDAADAMAAVLADHREIQGFDVFLDGVADVAQARPGLDRADAAPHGLEAHLGQALGRHRGLAHVVHAAGVAVEAVLDDGDIDIDDVAGFELAVVGDAVADHVVDRGADGLGKAPVIEVGRDGALDVDDVLIAQPVELLGGDARHHMGADHVEHLGGQPAGLAHLELLFWGLDGDMHYLGSWVARKTLFLRDVHGIKRGPRWQRREIPYAYR